MLIGRDTRVIRPIWTRLTRLTAWPVAAAFAVAIGALVIWNVNMQFNDPPENLVHFMKEADGDRVRIEAKTSDDDAISLGVFNTDDEGNWTGDMDVPLERGDQIALTEEVPGGSNEPTMEPLISTRL